MAIIKIINRKLGKTYALKAVLDYVQNPAKTEDGLLCSAKDCLLECAWQQMLIQSWISNRIREGSISTLSNPFRWTTN